MSEATSPSLIGNTLVPTPEVGESEVTDLYGAIHNDEAFQKLLDQPGHEYVPELVTAYYLRGHFIGGAGPLDFMPEEEPLYTKLLAVDPAAVENPSDQENITLLQEALRRHQGGQAGDTFDRYVSKPVERMIAARFVPGVIRKHGVETADTLFRLFSDRIGQKPNQESALLFTDSLGAVNDLLAADATQEADPFSRMQLAAHAEQAGDAFVQWVEYYDQAPEVGKEVSAGAAMLGDKKEEILTSELGVPPEELGAIRSLKADATVNYRVMESRQAFDGARQIIHKLQGDRHLQRLIKEPSPAFADFYKAFDTAAATGLDLDMLVKAGARSIAKDYAQASKLESSDVAQIRHYAERVSHFIEDITAMSTDPNIWTQYTDFLERGGPMSAREERRAVQLFRAAQKFNVAGISEEITDLDELEQGLINTFVSELTSGERTLSEEQKGRLIEALGSIAPLFAYGQKHMNTPGFKEALSDLTFSVADGYYESWRRGDGSAEMLRQLVDAGYLPERTSLEQYRQWITDHESDSREQMVGSAEDTAKIIRGTVENASDDVAGMASGYAFKLENLPVVIEERNGLGRLLGALHRTAQGSESVLQGEQIDALESSLGEVAAMGEAGKFIASLRDGSAVGEVSGQISEIQGQLDQLALLIRIANIDAEEVAAGALLKDSAEDGTRKVQQRLDDILDRLTKDLPPDLQFIPQSVTTLLGSHAEVNGQKELFSVEDTIDPKVTLEIGAVPQRTCQHYETGSHNEGLIGYFNPDVKILIVRNAKGGIIGRSIMRLMQDEEGKPVLFTEPVYQSVASTQIADMLDEHAESKAAAMGIELYGKTRGGRVEGFKELTVRTLKMPVAYSDTAEGTGLKRGALALTATVIADR